MTTFTITLVDPDGFQSEPFDVEAETARQAIAEARRDNRITYSDFVASVRETVAV